MFFLVALNVDEDFLHHQNAHLLPVQDAVFCPIPLHDHYATHPAPVLSPRWTATTWTPPPS